MAVSIKTSYDACRKAFDDFIEHVRDLDEEMPEGFYIRAWQDELGRLRMWAGNIGAHQTGQWSLDFRLRDSSHIRQQIIKLLEDLPQRLQDVRDVIAEGEDEDLESLDGTGSESEDPQSEIEQLRESVATTINCLFEMSMLVRTPAQMDHRIGSNKADVAYFEPYDRAHVRNKFPKADVRLVSRLGRAITRRRMYLKYRERHAMKLRQGLDPGSIDENGSDILSETVATAVQSPDVNFDDGTSESGISDTSYARTLMSTGIDLIPAPPKAGRDGAPFVCPYCHFIITVTSTKSWARHVFNDLQPYVCMDVGCPTPTKLFTRRREWLHHESTAHTREEHLGIEPGNHEQGGNCVLCSVFLANKKRSDQHLARHLQELASFVSPSERRGFRFAYLSRTGEEGARTRRGS